MSYMARDMGQGQSRQDPACQFFPPFNGCTLGLVCIGFKPPYHAGQILYCSLSQNAPILCSTVKRWVTRVIFNAICGYYFSRTPWNISTAPLNTGPLPKLFSS